MNPLFNDIQMRLFYLNHSPYSWHWNVRFRHLEAVYIGNDTCHITITCNQSGFHLIRDGQRLSTERYIRNLNELLLVLKRRWDVTPAIIRAVEYLSRVSERIPTSCSCLIAWKGCYSELKRHTQLVDAIYLVGREF